MYTGNWIIAMQKNRRNVLRIIAGSAAITSTNVASAESSRESQNRENPHFRIINNKTEDAEVTVRISEKSSGTVQLDERFTVVGKRNEATSRADLPNIVKARLDLTPGTKAVDVLADGEPVSEFTLDVGPDGVPDYVTYSIKLTDDGAEIAQELE